MTESFAGDGHTWPPAASTTLAGRLPRPAAADLLHGIERIGPDGSGIPSEN